MLMKRKKTRTIEKTLAEYFEEWRISQEPSQLRAETAWQTIERAFKDAYSKGAFNGAAAMQERCAIDYDKLAEMETIETMTVDDMARMIARYFAGHTYNINEFIECRGLALSIAELGIIKVEVGA